MNFVIKLTISEYAVKPLFILMFTGVFFLVFASLGTYDIGYSKKDQTSSTSQGFESLNIPQSVNESYTNNDAGFHILLPSGWSGLSYQNTMMISPAGVNVRTANLGSLASGGNTVLMVIEALNASDFVNQKNNSSGIENSDCSTVSDKYVKIKSLNGREVLSQCGSDNNDKIMNYIFGSGNKVIIVGLKGTSAVFESNLDKFKSSVNTLSIDKPTDISKIG